MMCLDTTLRYEDLCRCLSNVEKGEDGREGARAQNANLARQLCYFSTKERNDPWIREGENHQTSYTQKKDGIASGKSFALAGVARYLSF